jgi:hypothetical protein
LEPVGSGICYLVVAVGREGVGRHRQHNWMCSGQPPRRRQAVRQRYRLVRSAARSAGWRCPGQSCRRGFRTTRSLLPFGARQPELQRINSVAVRRAAVDVLGRSPPLAKCQACGNPIPLGDQSCLVSPRRMSPIPDEEPVPVRRSLHGMGRRIGVKAGDVAQLGIADRWTA